MKSDATLRQNRASHPDSSTWVSANAGSGKTRVLTDRVARLLLNGALPQKILCLTYTKAAAAEMQNRLFKRLGSWAMMPDDALRVALTDIGEAGQSYTSAALGKTRTHFARALETPGGLKIQTIHAFCANLLRRFPLEAGVSPQFNEMDEGASQQLRRNILDEMAGGSDTRAFDALARNLTDEGRLDALVQEVLKIREDLDSFDRNVLARALGISPGADIGAVHARTMRVMHDILSDALINYLKTSEKVSEKKLAQPLDEARTSSSAARAFAPLEQCLLTKSKTPIKAIPTGSMYDNAGALAEALQSLQDIVFEASSEILAIRSLERSTDLHLFAAEFCARFEAEKSARNLLDFDDLIDRTRSLLSDRAMTDWVLYKIDGGIDHILVDEAQDTSPKQWEIIRALSEDFTVGLSASEVDRTLFVVGDKKQSIFGFQGADPEEFTSKERFFDERLRGVGKRLDVVELPTSFRSAPAILKLVDKVFADDDGALGGAPRHEALAGTPGRVDLWPFEQSDKSDPKPPWWEPVDTMAKDNPKFRLAEQIADFIAGQIADEAPLFTKSGARPITPGDFLVLVRSRSAFFHVLIDKLKERGVPVAGADRMKVTRQLAVRDLISLLRFLDNEFDDLSLAEALRSPLFGLSEQGLFTLAHARKGTLWSALKASDHSDVVAQLRGLRAAVGFSRPYEILSRILTELGGRVRLSARLGAECEDAIDELLAQAIAFESTHPPTLSGFLYWLSVQEIELKRDMEADQDQVRVMTVHGAKGLEAPIVILPDVSALRPWDKKPALANLDGQWVWTGNKETETQRVLDLDADRRAKETAEYARLLYVALTRAENWLVVAGAGDRIKEKYNWYERVEAAMSAMPGTQFEEGRATFREGWDGVPQGDAERKAVRVDLPGWARAPVPGEIRQAKTIAPSGFGGSHALPGEPGGDGVRRGEVIHALLEYLPELDEADWTTLAQTLCGEAFDPAEILAEVRGVLGNPELAELFAPTTLVEVGVTAPLPSRGDQKMLGRIDRLIIREHEIIAVDFKSNAVVPERPQEVPEAILAQQGAYVQALGQIYAGKTVSASILWTKSARLMALPHSLVIGALHTATLG